MQAVLHQKCVVHGGDDREDESGAQESGARDPDPACGLDQQQQHKEDRGHLGEGVGFSEDAGTEIAQAGDHEQHAADQQDRNVAAEHDDRIFPGNQLFDGEDEKHGTHQQLVGDGIEILAEERLLMQGASEEAIEAVAYSGQNEECQRPLEIVFNQIDDDEGQKDHPQQRELIGSGQDLPEIHRGVSPLGSSRDDSPRASRPALPAALPRNSLTKSGAGSSPVFWAKR